MTADVLATMHEAATAIRAALDHVADWELAGTIDGQYTHDIAADRAGIDVLRRAGFGVLSEESGLHEASGPVVVLDPVDGSTNASRDIPWWNTSLCAVDEQGMQAAVVVDQVRGLRYEAVRGRGATRDGTAIGPSGCVSLHESILVLNGYPPRYLGWKQFRVLGAAALDLCAVAAGIFDGFVDCTRSGLSPWDYLGGALVCLEAGACVATLDGSDLVCRSASDRRVIVAAATPNLLAELLDARRSFG